MAWYVFLDPSGPNVLSNSQTQDQRIFWDFIILLDSSYSGENEFQFVKIGARVPYFCLICLLSPNCPKLVFRPETQNVTALGSIFFFMSSSLKSCMEPALIFKFWVIFDKVMSVYSQKTAGKHFKNLLFGAIPDV